MIEDKVKEYYSSLWHLPPNEENLVEFAELILKQFIEELEDSAHAVAWNYGCDAVIFKDKVLEGRVSLKEMKEKYLVKRNNKSNSVESHGTRDQGASMGDQAAYMAAQQPKSPAEIQEQNEERHREAHSQKEDS